MYHGNVNLRFVRTKKLQGGLESCSPSWNSWPHRSLSVDHRVEADWALDQREGGKAFLAIVCRGWTPCSGRLSTWSEGGRQGLLGNRLQRLNTVQRWWKIAADGSTLLAEDLQWVIDGKRGEAQGIAISEGAAQVVVRGDDGEILSGVGGGDVGGERWLRDLGRSRRGWRRQSCKILKEHKENQIQYE